jgi:DNA-binding beta-propeller fold protein YncE
MRSVEVCGVSTAVLCLDGCGGSWAPARGKALVWGGPGRRDGQFIRPRAIATNRGEVFVVDTTGRIQVFTPEGSFKRLWSTPDYRNGTPTGLTFDTDGNVVVPDTHYSHILKYDRQGKMLEQWGEYGSAPGRFVYPTDVALGPDGCQYICEYGLNADRMQVFDASRKLIRYWGGTGEGPGRFSRLMGVEMNRKGELCVADTGNHRVQCFDTQGKLLRIVSGPGTEPGKIKFPYQIALAPDDSIFACEYGNHRISRFRADGGFVAAVGRPGREPGAFNAPRGVAVSDDGLVFVADTENHRVQRFRLEAWS